MEWLKNSKIIIIAVIFVIFFLIAIELFLNPIEETIPQATATINSHTINLEIATTQVQQNKGLSGRLSMPEDHGMLFIFEGYQNQSFWMKDMQFSIDIVWIKDNTVVGFTKDLPIPTELPLPIYSPPEPINFVLELNQGAIDKYNIKTGDIIEFNYN